MMIGSDNSVCESFTQRLQNLYSTSILFELRMVDNESSELFDIFSSFFTIWHVSFIITLTEMYRVQAIRASVKQSQNFPGNFLPNN